MHTAFLSSEGYNSGQFLVSIDRDVVPAQTDKLNWPVSLSFEGEDDNSGSLFQDTSHSYKAINNLASQPLVSTMGPLSKLMAYCADHVRDTWLIQTTMDDTLSFSKMLHAQWRQIRLSAVDPSEEVRRFTEPTFKKTMPTLWRLLRSALFLATILVRAIIGRVLNDRALAQPNGMYNSLAILAASADLDSSRL